jgi:uncharacterized protein (TIGR02598 family)
MKLIRFRARRKRRHGFSLVEGVISIGVVSFGFLALAPLLVVGMNGAREARENRTTAQIAATLIEEARQGTPAARGLPFDAQGRSCTPAAAIYTVDETQQTIPDAAGAATPLTRLTLRVAPLGLPGAARTYADVFPTPP